jgi:hypothetical protein
LGERHKRGSDGDREVAGNKSNSFQSEIDTKKDKEVHLGTYASEDGNSSQGRKGEGLLHTTQSKVGGIERRNGTDSN